MRRTAGLLVATLLFMVMIQGTFAGSPETVTAEDVEFTKLKLDIVAVDYNDSFPSIPKIGGGKKLKYPMILLEYEWMLEAKAKKKHKNSAAQNGYYYIDNMEFEWRVVLAKPTKGKAVRLSGKNYNIDNETSYRMRKKIRYSNVSSNGKHYACMFIEPRMIDRLFRSYKKENTFIELVIKIEGEETLRINAHGEKFASAAKIAGEKGEEKLMKYIPKRRSSDPSFFLSEKVREVGGVLLSKDQTPWALSHKNIFETIVVGDKKDQ